MVAAQVIEENCVLLIVSSYWRSLNMAGPLPDPYPTVLVQISSLYVLVDGKTAGGVQAVLPGEAQWEEAAVAAHTGPRCT